MALEGFESTTGPNGLPSTVWPLGTGNWTVFDNGVGTGQRWGINNTTVVSPTPPIVYAGTNSAYMNRENIGINNTSEDYLVTPLITVPTNGQVRFFSRSFTSGNQGTLYQVKIATANPTNPASYTLLQEFTEDQLSAVYNIYEEKILDIPNPAGSQIYIAFVMKFTQTTTGIGGDRWLLDNVRVASKCLTPTITSAAPLTLNGGTLTWSNPSGATSWEIEIIPATATPTGVANYFQTGTPSLVVNNLQPGTSYKAYIRAICSPAVVGDPTVSSSWSTTAYNFTTLVPGLTCASPVTITTLPFVTNTNTSAFGDTTDAPQPLACAGTATNYMAGNDAFYSYTATSATPITVTLSPTGNGSGVFVYQGCANVGVTCVGGAANTGNGPRVVTFTPVPGQTYIIVVSSSAALQTFPYNLTIIQNSCTNIAATFSLVSNCSGTSTGFFVRANVTSLGTATSVVATDNLTPIPSPSQTITAPGIIDFGPYPNGTNVALHLENGSDPNCFLNSTSFTQQFCPFTNDLCINAIPVVCGSNQAQTTVGATTTGAPTTACGTSGTGGSGGLWYSYLGNGDVVTASLCNSTFNTRIQVVTGACGAFTCVAGNDDSCATQSVATFITTPGVMYYIYVYGAGTAQGVFTLSITCVTPPPPPVNDNCATATVVPVNTDGSCTQTVNGTVIGALASPEPNTCVGTADDDVWYQFTATATSHVISLTNIAGSTLDLNHAVYSTTNQASPCGALTQILCSNPNLSVVTGLTVGNVYLIRVYTAGNALLQTTTFTLCISSLPPIPVNDDCANATVAPVNTGVLCTQSINGYTTSATASANAVGCGNAAAANDDVWYQFVATQTTHLISISNVQGTVTDMYHALYSGTCGALVQRYCSDPDNSTATGLVVGQTYFIRVYTASTAANQIASFTLCIGSILPPIATSTTTYTTQALIEDVFLGSPCASVTNITSQTGAGTDNGIGYFSSPTPGSFPFNDGIVLATRGVNTVPGPNGAVAPPAGTWGGDAQLLNYIQGLGIDPGLTSYNNASKLEFDFIPIDPTITFDFIFASDEYGTFQCSYSDAFAFFLTNLSTGVTTNLAVVPGVTPVTPIAVTTIRDQAYNAGCASVNANQFGQFYGTGGVTPLAAPIDFNGVTKQMQASSAVIPGQQYHIKMVIADRNDSAFDSAIFLKAGSLNIGQIELGQDFLESNGTALCAGNSYTLQSGLDPNNYLFTWALNGVTIAGQTGANLVVTTSGTYTLSASYITGTCTTSDSVTIEFYAPVAGGTPNTLTACNSLGYAQFDLSTNNASALGSLSPTANTVTYYATLADAQAEVSPLPTLYTNTTQYTQTIYVRVENNTNGCYTTSQFNLNVQVPPQFTVTPDFTICAGTSGTISVTPTNFALANATYTWTLNGVALTDTTSTITVTQAGIYEVTVNNSGCTATATTTVTITALPLVDAPAPVTQCTAYTLPALTNGNYYTGTGGTGTMLTAGTVIPATQTLYIYAQVGTNPVCYSENIFVITITPQITPVFTQLGPFCQFDTAPTLPTTSNNGISGTWNAALSTATAGSTVYTFTPTATLCNGGVTMTVVVNPKPVLPTVAPIERCDGYVLPALPANVSYHTAANGGGTILTAGTNITTSQLIYVYGTSGTTPNCSSETSFNVTITSTPQFTIEAGCDGSEFVLEAIAVNNSYNPSTVTYNWTDSNNTSVGSSSTYSATQTGIYTLTITVPSTSCADSEDYNVTQTACIIQKGISPNGDGSNDSLDLVGFNVKELSIFNRYGAKVYSKTEYTNQWYGQTDKGDELPDGTYYFVIERKDAPTKSGWVYINRVK